MEMTVLHVPLIILLHCFLHPPPLLGQILCLFLLYCLLALSIDFIATRDIQPGKELFIDYGQEWVDAWNTYVKEWKPPERSHSFTSGVELQSDLSIPLKTSLEQQTEPYSENVVFYCHY